MVGKSWEQIETERLILRKFTSEDSAFLLELMNSPTWLQFIGQRNITTTDDARNYILEKFIKSYQTNGFGLNLWC
jgi:RimJ/RimL family protein N-acetyltransferase